MTDERYNKILSWMRHLHVDTALKWCDSSACACLGCANNSGGLNKRGVTKEEWQEWWGKAITQTKT